MLTGNTTDTRLPIKTRKKNRICISLFLFEVTWCAECAQLNTQISVTSLGFKNYNFDDYSSRYGLEFRLGPGLELG